MRTNGLWARGRPLAILIVSALVIAMGPLALAETPYLQVRQTLDPQEIYVKGTDGKPDVATLTLILEGTDPGERFPIDCLLVIDVSATARISEAKEFAFDLMELFSTQDRIGLVSFSTTAQLDLPLTSNRSAVKAAIADLETGGKSAFGTALQLARQELLQNGRDGAILVEVLLTDGQSNIGRDPQLEGNVAEEAGIKIVPVGIGTLINRGLLDEFASRTGGLFFPRPTETTVERIKDLLFVELATRNIWIEKVLPPEIAYSGASLAPTQVEENTDGTTSLIWVIGQIPLGEQWLTRITIKAREKGTWQTDQESFVAFTDFRGVEERIPIPVLELAAVKPPSPPQANFSYSPTLPKTTDVVSFTDHSTDPDDQIVQWLWDFGDGGKSEEQHLEHHFSRSGIYTVSLSVVDEAGASSESMKVDVSVANSAPVAIFTCDPKEPRMGVEVLLDAGGSVDPDGEITSYAWDFNKDGVFDVETISSDTLHVFLDAGERPILLRVLDNEGASTLYEKVLYISPSVSPERTIGTCLPDDETIAGATVVVTVTITANTEVHGLTLRETIPEGWTFEGKENGRATVRKDGETIEWLFLETLLEGNVREICYTLTSPQSNSQQKPELVTIRGIVGSSSPRLSQMVLGEDKISRVDTLPVEVVISRWNSDEEDIDLCLPEQVSFDQMQYAISLWLSGDPVPYTADNQVIDLAVIQDLIAYWLTDTSVHDPLP